MVLVSLALSLLDVTDRYQVLQYYTTSQVTQKTTHGCRPLALDWSPVPSRFAAGRVCCCDAADGGFNGGCGGAEAAAGFMASPLAAPLLNLSWVTVLPLRMTAAFVRSRHASY